MFIPHEIRPPHRLVGKTFELTEETSNMTGTFEKGTKLTVTEINGTSLKGFRSVFLEDEYRNKLLLHRENFNEICKEIK